MTGGNRKGKHDIAPVVRKAFLGALEEVSRQQDKTFSQVMAGWMEKDPIALLNAVSKFAVKEKTVSGKVEHDHKHDHKHRTIQETSDWLEQTLAGGEDSASEESLPH